MVKKAGALPITLFPFVVERLGIEPRPSVLQTDAQHPVRYLSLGCGTESRTRRLELMRLDVSPDTFRNVYPRVLGGFFSRVVAARRDSNPQRSLCKRVTLPIELRACVVEVAGVEPVLFLCAKQMPSH